ncbi:MAG: hypothetical protein H6R01_1506 [Burkholderiaceae bacterium]|nr:hypothetical protein [Burkholderiaceae bacterium]
MATKSLRAARASKPSLSVAATAVPMPRFRNKVKSLTQTDIVRAVLRRARPDARPFALFVFSGRRAVICGTETKRFVAMSERYPDSLVGTYDARLTVTGLLGDLQGFCELEGAL